MESTTNTTNKYIMTQSEQLSLTTFDVLDFYAENNRPFILPLAMRLILDRNLLAVVNLVGPKSIEEYKKIYRENYKVRYPIMFTGSLDLDIKLSIETRICTLEHCVDRMKHSPCKELTWHTEAIDMLNKRLKKLPSNEG